MAQSTINANYTTVTAATLSRWLSKDATKLWAYSNVLMMKLAAKKGFAEKGYGTSWKVPVRYPVSTGPQVVRGTDSWSGMPQPTEMGGWTVAEFQPAKYAFKMALPRWELNMQDAETQRIPLAVTAFEQAKDIVATAILTDFWAAEGATGSGGNSDATIGSILTYINGGGASTDAGGVSGKGKRVLQGPLIGGTYTATGTSPVTKVGGIERNGTSGAYWTPNIFTPGSAATLTPMLLNKMINVSTWGNRKPDLIVAGPMIYSYLQSVLQNQQRSNLDKYGFTAFEWLGIDVALDQNVPETPSGSTNQNQLFGLNTASFKLYFSTLSPQFEAMRDVAFPDLDYYYSSMNAQLVTDDPGIQNFRHTLLADPS